jgi:hypothetical protein
LVVRPRPASSPWCGDFSPQGSARLFAVSRPLVGLAGVAGVLAATTTFISIDGIWREERCFLVAQTTSALWIVAVLCCLLVPLLERYRAETEPTPG